MWNRSLYVILRRMSLRSMILAAWNSCVANSTEDNHQLSKRQHCAVWVLRSSAQDDGPTVIISKQNVKNISLSQRKACLQAMVRLHLYILLLQKSLVWERKRTRWNATHVFRLLHAPKVGKVQSDCGSCAVISSLLLIHGFLTNESRNVASVVRRI